MILKIFFIVFIVFIALFILSLVVFLFNLDMKAAAWISPILDKHYDKVKRDRMV